MKVGVEDELVRETCSYKKTVNRSGKIITKNRGATCVQLQRAQLRLQLELVATVVEQRRLLLLSAPPLPKQQKYFKTKTPR